MNVHLGECVAWLESLPAESVDSIVCDPPYGLGFMGKKWDALPPGPEWAAACLRVLKPGGHLVAFGGTRTVHRLTCAVEDAGFEIRDTISWCYWSGFPKSLDVSKAIDKAAGADRPIVGPVAHPARNGNGTKSLGGGWQDTPMVTAPGSEDSKLWAGWGTALKPSNEPAVLARKPLGSTVAECTLTHGTGALNVDGCRFASGSPEWLGPQDDALSNHGGRCVHHGIYGRYEAQSPHIAPGMEIGRWPANLLYVPKPSRAERERGTAGLPGRSGAEAVDRADGSAGMDNPRAGAGRTAASIRNFHPTVKPVRLMRWLVRLVTPPGGLAVDPFTGSGSTGVAATLEGFDFAGAEMEPDYHRIALARIAHARDYPDAWADTTPGSRPEDTLAAKSAGEQRATLEALGQLTLLGAP